MLASLTRLSGADLLAEVARLAAREREATAALIAHLAELDARRLYLTEGCASLFTYCTQVLHLSEHAAYGRIEAARAARRYPVLLERLADGSVTLTTVTLLAPHLTPENYRDLLDQARHKSRREVEALVAALRPQPPVPASVRQLPPPRPAPAAPLRAAPAASLLLAPAAPLLPVPSPTARAPRLLARAGLRGRAAPRRPKAGLRIAPVRRPEQVDPTAAGRSGDLTGGVPCSKVRIIIQVRRTCVPTATITSKGQLTLPKAIRDQLGVGPGDRVDFVVKDDGTVVVRPVTVHVRDLKGFLHRPGMKPLSIEEMNAVIRRRGAGLR